GCRGGGGSSLAGGGREHLKPGACLSRGRRSGQRRGRQVETVREGPTTKRWVMASGKKRRKQAKLARKPQTGAGPQVHRDGDRRRRAEMTAALKAAAQRRALEQLPGVILPEGK